MGKVSIETRKRMSESAKARCSKEWRRMISENRSLKLNPLDVESLYLSGLSQIEVARQLNVSQSAICNFMRKHNIKARSRATRNQKGENNHMWKGSRASYVAKHNRVYRNRGKASRCLLCGATYYVEWACVNNDYDDINSFIELCSKCHRRFDRGLISMDEVAKALGVDVKELKIKKE